VETFRVIATLTGSPSTSAPHSASVRTNVALGEDANDAAIRTENKHRADALSGEKLCRVSQTGARFDVHNVAAFRREDDPSRERTIKNHQAAAEALGVTLWNEDITGPEDVEPVFAKIADNHADGVVRGTSGGLFIPHFGDSSSRTC